ncbi:hypothetical protein MJO29_001372 [Puccinia striiformis f. sp. tritici]|uniref:Uncharacterized protein n=4 Tax=Puccinia striiformis TaxID=27350 RepID=A0A2S4U9Z4_9BASI|nr:hypothetical protein MJO29_003975 [Puccinia striiformis f. sp. tritici]KAI9608609.1 hypothetical protein H4Q26_004794 [Puccinia striiformis f. sp. tritici PST-130]POV94046.1 hypothetical protein PSHT_16464 [Puccinia striiformis]KAI7965624.1 hypothetical protein MJO29_001372 [Puccinia striiformis f. sp. tritici]KAI9610800.1 hypothetical protein KEM48_004719 [Puccinia striiformis f. sp. tritici PST-130]
MTANPSNLQNGSMPTTVTNLRSQLCASGIPDGNSAFARSIHDFTRVVLGVEAANSDVPPSPPQSQLATFETPSNEASASSVILARFRSYLSEHNLSSLEVGGRIKCIPVVCRQFFVQDMARVDVHHVSFAWDQDPDSPYNMWFASMIWKHWTFAKNTGLLYKYAISPSDDTAANGKKVMFRWIHGRQAELRQAARNLNWRQVKAAREKRSKRKKQLSDHRVDTCVALAVPATLTRIFMNPAATSDTEEDDAGNLYRMHVPWRSQELTQFAHKLDEATVERLRKQKGVRYVQRAKLLELRRRDPINIPRVVPVPVSFPQNCYSPIFLQSRGQVAQGVLNAENQPCEFPAI